MSWQGIPFKLFSDDTEGAINLALQSIPKIIVDTPTDYTPSIVTAVVSLIAGVIPAGIAIWTFNRNSKNTRIERVSQQKFLARERAEQQRFLREERAAQIASTEKDRETQLSISKKNFDMQVLSVNRQAWINNLRDLLAEYMALTPLLLDAKFKYINTKEHYQKLIEHGAANQKFNKDDIYREELSKRSLDFNKSLSLFDDVRTQERLLIAKVKMMLSPREKWYSIFDTQFKRITLNYNDLNDLNMDDYKEKLRVQGECIESTLVAAQELLKYEWERVKKGV
ncbi:hypothetical protein [Serratia sp. S119]|uniref:hypothetical protein n=1 Tax=Serratia sp. S119 TaxID=1118230 RepID=UPI0009CEEFC0|nr:hypothetical protein [Serratia sp. S119]ONK17099.1 hypothetical protein BHT35_3716 [Serratia sp. S119]